MLLILPVLIENSYAINLHHDVSQSKEVEGREVVIIADLVSHSNADGISLFLKTTETSSLQNPEWPAGSKYIEGVNYKVKVYKNDTLLFDHIFNANDQELEIIFKKVQPSANENSFTNLDNNTGIYSDKSIFKAIFLEGGLYYFDITLLGMEGKLFDPQNQVTFDIYMALVDRSTHQITIDGISYPVEIISYFDKPSEVSYDFKRDSLTATLPFNWNNTFSNRVENIHLEIVMPEKLLLKLDGDFKATLNGLPHPILVESKTTGIEKSTVIHYHISGDKVKEINRLFSDGIYSEKLEFIVQFDDSNNESFNMIANSFSGQYIVTITGDKQLLDEDTNSRLLIKIENTMGNISSVSYNLHVLDSDGNISNNKTSSTDPDGTSVEIINLDSRGYKKIIISNIAESTGEQVEFPISVVPEFPFHLTIVAAGISFVLFTVRKMSTSNVGSRIF